jgi:hypothetical protein
MPFGSDVVEDVEAVQQTEEQPYQQKHEEHCAVADRGGGCC